MLDGFPFLDKIGKDRKIMEAKLIFKSSELSAETLRVVLASAQEWGCSPGQAAARLVEELECAFHEAEGGQES